MLTSDLFVFQIFHGMKVKRDIMMFLKGKIIVLYKSYFFIFPVILIISIILHMTEYLNRMKQVVRCQF